MSDFTPFDEAGHMAQTQAGMEAFARAHGKVKETKVEPIEVKIIPDDMMQGCKTGGYVRIHDENGENPIEVFIGHFGLGIIVGPTDIYNDACDWQFTSMIVDSDGAVAMIPPQSEDHEDYNGTIERRFNMNENNEDYEEETHQILLEAR